MIQLTKGQQRQLKPLLDRTKEDVKSGKRSAIGAQVYDYVMDLQYIKHECVKEIQDVVRKYYPERFPEVNNDY